MSSRVKIADICTRICSGGTPKSGVVEFYENGKIPWLNTGEINFNRIRHTNSYITEAGLASSSAKWISKNSISIAMYGATAGKAAVVKIPLTTNQACCNLEVNESVADYRFVYYWLQSNYSKLANLANGGAQQNLSAKTIKALEIDLPPMPIQHSVAEVLSQLDDKLELNNRLNDYLAELRNTLVKERISSALEHGIGNWRVVSLKDVAQIQSGYSYKSAELVAESSIGMLGIKNFNRNGSFRSDGFKPLKPEKAKSAQYVALGEIVVAHTDLTQNADIIGRAIQVIDSGGYDQMVASLDLVKVTSSDDSISNEFLAALLSTEDFHNHCLGYVNGTTVLHLGKKALPEYQLKIPEDMAIMSELDDAFKSIAQQQAILIRESRHLERIRDALLPKLISGDIDVSKIEVSTPSNNHLCAG